MTNKGHSEKYELFKDVMEHRLRQDDIRQVLNQLSLEDRDFFVETLTGTFDKLNAVLEVTHQVSDILTLDILFTRLVELTTEALRADRGTIFLNDPETDELFSRVAMGELTQEIRFPNHLGIAGSVFTSGESIIIDDAYADSRFNPEVDKKTGYRTRNIITAPIRGKDGIAVGVVQLLNKQEKNFSEHDLSLLEAMAAQAASALINAHLFEQVTRARKEETQLLEVTKAISKEIHLKPLINRIMSTTSMLLEADRSTLFLNDEKTNELWSMVAQGMETKEIRFPNHLGIAGSVFTSGSTVNIPDAYSDSRFNPDVDKKTGYRTNTILCMPVKNKSGKIIGVVQSLNKKGGPFTVVDEKRLHAFSAQASIAIENATLFEEVLTMKNYNESMLESMANGVVTFNEDGIAEKCNSSAERILEIREMDILAKKADALFMHENEWIASAIYKTVSGNKTELVMDAELGTQGKIKSVNLSTKPLVNSKGENLGVLLVLEDISSEKRLKGTLARYMTKEVADQLMDNEAMLGGQLKEATVFFSDIRSFTTLSESLGAQETVSMLNDYFTDMVEILFERGGILDKYIGDAIMAVFGTPFATDRDADHAVLSAIDMMRSLRDFNERRLTEGHDPIDIGIGLNTAPVVVGNIGSLKRMDYTVIGDGVNLAARLEGANKMYGSHILLSEFTVAALKDDYLLREADLIQVKGKTEPVAIYEVLDHAKEEQHPLLREVVRTFAHALEVYRNREFESARMLFKECLALLPGDKMSAMYIDRCDHFISVPPADDWDGVWVMKSK
ncbi:adenylate/guanylate cyclase domain-containing protein [Maridesulfovibrio salexigens]|uniref:Adenylate/guanylate cyclase with GAF and PAS/PAC sensors n=1 Tax=Maridesulfovibrio salexigens (strain ATCC 14822 / DSM 2638 / NCIMB 8403 / VKM B-1763) TaxID=526222 RepID=C6C0B6_MARSD|nr:adenylate/guanylate cyclase domain-containing protein [Maridesulfovibrio salexigens]ACS79050.1 adenylate/guanylate cyclase with GAF and PAS/PAC sensors [Maridesulfovibrio salexigens DSM 2638]